MSFNAVYLNGYDLKGKMQINGSFDALFFLLISPVRCVCVFVCVYTKELSEKMLLRFGSILKLCSIPSSFICKHLELRRPAAGPLETNVVPFLSDRGF